MPALDQLVSRSDIEGVVTSVQCWLLMTLISVRSRSVRRVCGWRGRIGNFAVFEWVKQRKVLSAAEHPVESLIFSRVFGNVFLIVFSRF